MEYTQWETIVGRASAPLNVLILVVMEYTQWDVNVNIKKSQRFSLNPCCNGIYSMSSKSYMSAVALS